MRERGGSSLEICDFKFLIYFLATRARLFFAGTFAGEALVAQSGEGSAYKRSYDEEPELRHSQCVLRENRLRDRTCRVDRGIGQRDRDKVDKGQRIRKTKVSTASIAKAPIQLVCR